MKVGGTISVILSYPSSGCQRILKLEVYMNIRRRTVLDHHEPYCFSRTFMDGLGAKFSCHQPLQRFAAGVHRQQH